MQTDGKNIDKIFPYGIHLIKCAEQKICLNINKCELQRN